MNEYKRKKTNINEERGREREWDQLFSLYSNYSWSYIILYTDTNTTPYPCRPKLSLSPPAHFDQTSRSKNYLTYGVRPRRLLFLNIRWMMIKSNNSVVLLLCVGLLLLVDYCWCIFCVVVAQREKCKYDEKIFVVFSDENLPKQPFS